MMRKSKTAEIIKVKVRRDVHSRLMSVCEQYGFNSVSEIVLCLITTYLDYTQCDEQRKVDGTTEEGRMLKNVFKDVCANDEEDRRKNKYKKINPRFAVCCIKKGKGESETFYTVTNGLYGRTKNKDLALLAAIRFLSPLTANAIIDFKNLNGYKTIGEALRGLIPFSVENEIENIFSEYTDAELQSYGIKPKRERHKSCI